MATPPDPTPGRPFASHLRRHSIVHEAARQQHGIVTRTQLAELGVTRGTIRRWIRVGLVRSVFPGSLLVGPTLLRRGLFLAAVRSAGPSAVLSHTSALELWGLTEPPTASSPSDVHVIAATFRRSAIRPGIRIHRVRVVEPSAVTVREGIPVTTVARTLLDCAKALGPVRIEKAIADAERAGLLTQRALVQTLSAAGRRPGTRTLRAVMGSEGGAKMTRSKAESLCLKLLRDAGLPAPATNVVIGPYEVDFFWRDVGLAVELDGYRYHSSRVQFERDRERDNVLGARGIKVMRITWRQIEAQPTATAVLIGQNHALAQDRRERERRARTTEI